MTKNKKRFISFLLLLCLLCAYTGSAYAAINATSVVISVSQVFTVEAEDSVDLNKVFHYQISPLHSANPMPEGTDSGAYTFTIKDSSSVNLFIHFDSEGVFSYNIKQVVQNKLAGYIYDEQTVKVDVHVEAGEGGVLNTVVVGQNEQGEKIDNIQFNNSYKQQSIKPPKPATPGGEGTTQTSDPSNIGLWVSILFISALGMAFLFSGRKKTV